MSSVFGAKLKNISDFQRTTAPDLQIIELTCDSIICLEQVRSLENEGFSDESLMELAESMKNDGQIEPVIVRPNPDKPNSYIMVAGERRFKAAKLFGLSLKAIVKDLDVDAARRIQIAENIHRQNLSQKEVATAVNADYIKLRTLEAVAKNWNKSVNWVSQMIKYFDALADPNGIAAKLVEKNITADVTAITDMDKLANVDINAAMNALDQLEADPNSNVRGVVKDKLKKAKSDKAAKQPKLADLGEAETSQLKSKLELECKTIEKLFKVATAAILINGVCIECSKDTIIKITISVINSPDSKVSQDLVYHANDYPLAQGFTALFKNLPADKLSEKFASHVYIK